MIIQSNRYHHVSSYKTLAFHDSALSTPLISTLLICWNWACAPNAPEKRRTETRRARTAVLDEALEPPTTFFREQSGHVWATQPRLHQSRSSTHLPSHLDCDCSERMDRKSAQAAMSDAAPRVWRGARPGGARVESAVLNGGLMGVRVEGKQK